MVLVIFLSRPDSEGERITFGIDEMKDLDAWYRYVLTRSEVDPERIGILGNSYGGMLAIHYAAQNKKIKAIVTSSGQKLFDATGEPREL
jgi:dienelactone hydrolase